MYYTRLPTTHFTCYTPTHIPKASPPGTLRSHTKRHNDGFITPPASKAARKVLLKTPGMAPVSLENRFNFPSNEIDAEFSALPATQPTQLQIPTITPQYNTHKQE
ncbi:hypothetical protein TNCT_54711 [Trichonephila clavata]|uniref:Uncharacterized protein n=1 Tax=Trichonephila clavata TaxID=2740835 RepID=A0A8X6HYB2_TRICU|nr:hypothetical protein TNCT_54711 [Trichonephila clavata]